MLDVWLLIAATKRYFCRSSIVRSASLFCSSSSLAFSSLLGDELPLDRINRACLVLREREGIDLVEEGFVVAIKKWGARLEGLSKAKLM